MLSEVALIHGGGRLGLSGNDFINDGFDAYGAAGLNGQVAQAEYSHQDAVILSSIGARCGKCFLVSGAWTSLANTQIIIPKPEIVDVRFLWYQLNDERRWHRSGSAQPFIKPADVKSHPVWVPPLEEQRRIAAILDQADAVRTKRRQVLAHLDLLDDAVFRTTSSAVLNRQPISALLSFRSGSFLPAKAQEPGGVRVYGGNGITGYHSSFLFEDSKVVVGRVGAYCGVVHVTAPRSWITDNALYVNEVHADLKIEYLAAALRAANLNQYASQSGQPLISAGRIAAVEIPVPTAEQQDAFVASSRAIARERDRVRSALSAESEMFMSLQSRAFRGDL